MKKSIAFLFALTLLAPFIGVYLGFRMEKVRISKLAKHLIINKLNINELKELTFNLSDTMSELNWEHPLEFEYHGRMYDVVKSIKNADSITYWCYCDDAETSLNQKYKLFISAINTGKRHDNQQQKHFTDFFKLFYFNEVKNHSTKSQQFSLAVIFPEFKPRITIFYSQPQAPPPKTV